MSDVANATTAPRREISQEVTEFAVASLVLDEHPGTLTEAEVIKHLCRGRPEQENAYYESIRELIGAGVLHLEGTRLHASEPVLRLARVAKIP